MSASRARVTHATTPPNRQPLSPGEIPRRPSRNPAVGAYVALSTVVAIAALLLFLATSNDSAPSDSVSLAPVAAGTLAVFLLAVWAWTFTGLDDTLVAFLAALALIVIGALPAESFFAALGDETIWLLICAFIVAAGVESSGLALRGATRLLRRARTPRGLFHLVTAVLVVTTFAVPATSGRAALAIPVFVALTRVLGGRDTLVRVLSLLFPTVILLSAVGSLLGAGAHIIASQVLEASTGSGFGFLTWLWFGLPLAVVSSHLACEIVLLRFTDRAERCTSLRIAAADIAAVAATPVTGALTGKEVRALCLLGGVIALWCTEPWHQIPPALVALLGAVAAVSPVIGCTTLAASVKRVPLNLLLFLAATLALASALTGTGAADWLGRAALAPLSGAGEWASVAFVLAVIALSLAAHLFIPSRSARSAALIPIVIALAPGLGVDPAAAAFASTAAAGFCHTLTSSAKPVAMFADRDTVPVGFEPRDLRSLSVLLAPAMFALIAVFSFWVWPAMGMPLIR